MKQLARLTVLLLALLIAEARPATAGSRLAIEGSKARITVTFDGPVALAIDQTSDRLVVEADQPFPDDLDALAATLEGGFARLRVDADRTTLRIAQHPSVVASASAVGDRALAIDLAATTSPALRLRTGQHADFVRAVIEPIEPRAVSVGRAGDRLSLDLPERLGADDLERLAGLAGIADLAIADRRLDLTLTPGTTVRDHIVGSDKLVLDIRQGAAGARPGKAATSPPPTPLAAARLAYRPMPRPVGPAPEAAAPEAIADPRAMPAGEPEVAAAARWQTPRFAELKVSSRALADRSIELRFEWPEPVPAAAFRRGGQLWLAFGAMTEAIDVDAPALTRIARRWISAMRAEPHAEATLFQLALTEMAPAAFHRDGSGWRLTLGPEASPSPADGTPRITASQTAKPAGTDRGEVIESVGDGVRLAGIDRVISMIDPVVGDRLGVGLALDEVATTPSDRPRFIGLRFLPTLQGTAWRELTDLPAAAAPHPDGRTLGPAQGVARRSAPAATAHAAVTALGEPQGEVEEEPDAVELESAPAAAALDHGEAVSLSLATASVRQAEEPGESSAVDDDGTTAGPEPAVPAAATAAAAEAAAPAVTEAGPLDLARHKARRGESFWSRRSDLLQQLTAAGADARQPVELALARLLVAHGLGLEALALLGEEALPGAGAVTVGGEPAARPALVGAGQFLAGRFAAARQSFEDPRLVFDDETALWRAAALAAGEQWDDALEHGQRGQSFLEHYPASTQAALGEHGVMLLLQTGRGDEAMALIERLAALRLEPAAADRVRALEAIALERDGAFDEARAIWRRLARAGSPESRSRAVVALVELDLASERIDLSQAIARLATDRLHWRGQADEIRLERRLAALQRSAGQPEAALATLRAVIDRQPAADAVEMITAEMSGIIGELFDAFVAGEHDATSTLQLYRQYGELLSPDDARVEKLARALAELGLGDAAIGLWRDRLARHTARDEPRARIGFELARLLAQEGDRRGALTALVDSTPVDAIPEKLGAARRTLMASLNDDAAARQAAAGSQRDILRQAFDRAEWPQVIERALPIEAALTPSEGLDAEAGEIVLMLATAASTTGDDALIEALQRRHGEALPAADAAILRLLTRRPRFAGDAATVLAKAAEHTRRARGALAALPAP